MMPQHPVPTSRLTELLEQIRVEFDTQVGQAGHGDRDRENFRKYFKPQGILLSANIRELLAK